jgi:hypothetical protein
MKTLLFENVPCSRCGGSGNYSYCQMYGTTCFKCAGDGATLTARGKAAQMFLNASRKRKAGEFKLGDYYLMDGVPGFSRSEWIKVTEIQAAENGTLNLVGTNKRGETTSYNGLTLGFELRKSWTKEEKKAQAQAALAFQATLTKAGTIRKRAAKKDAA